jgi:glycyl-tRNA synthetase beta chain
MSTKPLLIELFTEELPPKALKKLGEAFASGVETSLKSDGLLAADSMTESFATPRRLAVRASAVLAQAPAKAIKEKLMPLAVAKDASGAASPALKKKLAAQGFDPLSLGERVRGEGVALAGIFGAQSPSPQPSPPGGGSDIALPINVSKLVVESDGKADYVYLVGQAMGTALAVGVQNAIDHTLAKLPIPKVMNYQLADGVTEANFVRPAHGLIAMHGSDVIAAATLGLRSSNITHGHRFQGANNIEIDEASRYEELLREFGKVEPVFATRREMILSQLETKAKSLGASLGATETYTDLLDEVTSLVEWPTVYVCQFEAEFLAVPQECLILTMKTNQKYFPLFDANGKLKNQFLIVSNMELADASRVVTGNERVVRPRLADARFFFETDKKTKLADRVPQLANVVYHNKLGTQGERVQRLSKLAGKIATMIGADKAKAERAALLAKADLSTLMVGEFPELQGIMGRYYATADGEAADVAAACEQHYMPRFAGDRLPDAGVPTAVALADKLETLAGLFSIDQIPTGDKDPFALRRHALGVAKILIEQELDIEVPNLIEKALLSFPGQKPLSPQFRSLRDFFYERLPHYFRELGHETNNIQSVVDRQQTLIHLDPRPKVLADLPDRLAEVKAFRSRPEAKRLAEMNKRVSNIVTKGLNAGDEPKLHYDKSLFLEDAERELERAYVAASPKLDSYYTSKDFRRYFETVVTLDAPLAVFFDKVMVMAEDKAVRANRLALLRDLRYAMNKVADLSKLAT